MFSIQMNSAIWEVFFLSSGSSDNPELTNAEGASFADGWVNGWFCRRKSFVFFNFLFQDMKMNGMVRTTVYVFFGMSNRVEHQKLNVVAAELPPG